MGGAEHSSSSTAAQHGHGKGQACLPYMNDMNHAHDVHAARQDFHASTDMACAVGEAPYSEHECHPLRMQELRGVGRNGRGHHTWLFMVGYVYKGRGTAGYREFGKGISEEEKVLGREEYVKYGAVNKRCGCTCS